MTELQSLTTPESKAHKAKKYPGQPSGNRKILWLIVGLTVGLILGAAGIALALLPIVGNYDATATALRLTEQAQAETELDLWQTQTAQADQQSTLDSQATEISGIAQSQEQQELDNRRTQTAQADTGLLLNQTATQAAQNIVATQTALDIQNQRQSTQAAIDFAATQAALNQAATQVILDFQSTQAAIDQSAAPVPTRTPEATTSSTVFLQDTFATGLRTGIWEFSDTGWATGADGLTATLDDVWIRSLRHDIVNYRLEITLSPVPGEYVLLLNVQDDRSATGNLALQVSADEDRFGLVRLYAFDPSLEGLVTEQAAGATNMLALEVINQPLAEASLIVEVVDNQVRVWIDDARVLEMILAQSPEPGAVGLQLPVGATIRQIQVTAVDS